MNISSPIAKFASVLISLAVVAGAAQLSVPRTVVQEQGGGVSTPAQIGSKFEDMIAGTMKPVVADETAQVIQSAPAESVSKPQPIQRAEVQTAQPLKVQAMTPLAPAPPIAAAVSAPAPLVQTQPAPKAALPVAAALAIVAETPSNDAPSASIRPTGKNPELAAKAAEIQNAAAQLRKKTVKKKPAKVARKGTAKRNNTKGAKAGTKKKATAKASGKKKKNVASKAGNAAISNYPGKVRRRITRQSRPRVGSKGTATISFSVSSGGGLARVSVARSSGSAALDRGAIAMVRRAAPFPRPPAGARRKFTVRIQGR